MAVCAFREEQARRNNQPPFRVLPNRVLLDIALLMPRKRGELNQVEGLSPKLIQRYGSGLLAAVERGIVGPPAYRPSSRRPDDAVLERLDLLRNWRKLTAREMGVESDIILPRDVMEVIAQRDPQNLEELGEVMQAIPWRLHQFGNQILKLLGE